MVRAIRFMVWCILSNMRLEVNGKVSKESFDEWQGVVGDVSSDWNDWVRPPENTEQLTCLLQSA
jgi:hypothetical protein